MKLTEKGKNLLGALVFYAVLVLGVIALNARIAHIDECINEGHDRDYCVDVAK